MRPVSLLLARWWWPTRFCWLLCGTSPLVGSSLVRASVQVQRLIRNFLWSGGDGEAARAKVAWSMITFSTARGGLGVIDPACQSRALLGKLVVRGLLPGSEPWKELLLHKLRHCAPRTGGPWQPEIRWLFAEMRRVGYSRHFEHRFACSLLRTWELLWPALVQIEPSSAEEILRQPLVWSPLVRTIQGHMVGS